jgi:Sec-independent protein translocase protein TatA
VPLPGAGKKPYRMLSIQDMALLGAAALMFFGPEQLPKVARKVGLLVRDVQNTSSSFIREMERAGDTNHYGPDISRAHLIEEASGTTPAYTPPAYTPEPYTPPVYEPSVYEPSVYEPVTSEPHMAAMFAEHTEAEVPAESPVLHDIVAPNAPSAAANHDLPP